MRDWCFVICNCRGSDQFYVAQGDIRQFDIQTHAYIDEKTIPRSYVLFRI